jgi:hypothetical protein
MQPSDDTPTALDLARSWAPILMRSDGEGSVTERERELQVRVVEALITSAEEVFETDPTERLPDPSFSSVTLMPNVKPLAISERERSKEELSTASAMLRRSLWQSTVSSVPQVVSKCTEIIESSRGLLQIYQDDASAAEVLSLWRRLESRKFLALSSSYQQRELIRYPSSDLGSGRLDTGFSVRSTLAVATLLKALVAAKPHPLIALEDSDLTSPTNATGECTHQRGSVIFNAPFVEVISRSLPRSTLDGLQLQTSVPQTAHYEVLKTIMFVSPLMFSDA